MLTTAHITAKTATAAALITLRSEPTKQTLPKQNAPTAALLNIKADFCRGCGFTYYFSKTLFAKEMSLFVMQRENLKSKK